MKKLKALVSLCAVILAITAFSIPALAASIDDQMAANSAAWHIANAAGDTATCNALHAQNVALANQKAGSGGSATYNSSQGTWTIRDSSGNTTKSSGSSNGKTNTITYTTVSSNGTVSSTSARSYTDSSIAAYMNNGGTHDGLQTAYNNAAAKVTASGNYGSIESAASEVAVAKELLGLSDAEAAQLQRDLEASKQEYALAQSEYNAAVAAGDADAAAAAKDKMNEAHESAENTRANYNYTGDAVGTVDGGYYYENGQKVYTSSYGGGGFFNPTSTNYKITASCNDGGTITPYGENYVKRYGSITFETNAYDGYVIEKILVDNEEINIKSNSYYYYSWLNRNSSKAEEPVTEHTYTFSRVRATHTIEVVFASIDPQGGDDEDNNDEFFTIEATAGPGGSITPSGTVTVAEDTDQIFAITPDAGYVIESVVVDGINRGVLETYTFHRVEDDHTITATFKPSGGIDLGDIEITTHDGISLTSAGNSIKSGYGIFANVATACDGVTDVSLIMSYDFGQGNQTVTLTEGARGSYHFPPNNASPLRNQCVYIPVETQDDNYTLTFTLTARNATGDLLTETKTVSILIRGNMYEDDFTGDS